MKYILYLFVTGQTLFSQRALENIRQICESEIHGQYQLHVVDITEQPQFAEQERIIATPTLLKKSPEPQRKIIGDLSDREKVLLGLDILPTRPLRPTAPKEDKL